jgi:hypothetical protein
VCSLNLAMPSCGLASIMTESFSLLLGMQQKLLKIQIFCFILCLSFSADSSDIYIVYTSVGQFWVFQVWFRVIRLTQAISVGTGP